MLWPRLPLAYLFTSEALRLQDVEKAEAGAKARSLDLLRCYLFPEVSTNSRHARSRGTDGTPQGAPMQGLARFTAKACQDLAVFVDHHLCIHSSHATDQTASHVV